MESSFTNSENPAASPFVATLNHSRNSFKKILFCPLILFLPEYALSAIYHGATDFFTIRSGVYLFSAKAEETERQIERQVSEEYRQLQGLLLEERQNRIRTIKDLLAEYQSLPVSQRDLEKENHLKEKLADLYEITADYEKAEKLYLEVLDFARKANDEIFLSHTLNNLALVYESQGKYEEAIKLFTQALEIDEKTIGKEHPDYASRLNNLASVYKSQGKYEEAIKLFTQALEIGEKTIGKEHPDHAARLNNLAGVYESQGKYEEAIKLYKQALEIGEKTVGKDHPNYATQLNNLAGVYNSQG
ncbi:MAG TPA: tetratricopeptide repeat protein, partial [Pyrinomonadaceae bacterium]|nr:tetratricopeptide repeat protein [Pyrinomonadaceae bacterium]